MESFPLTLQRVVVQFSSSHSPTILVLHQHVHSRPRVLEKKKEDECQAVDSRRPSGAPLRRLRVEHEHVQRRRSESTQHHHEATVAEACRAMRPEDCATGGSPPHTVGVTVASVPASRQRPAVQQHCRHPGRTIARSRVGRGCAISRCSAPRPPALYMSQRRPLNQRPRC